MVRQGVALLMGCILASCGGSGDTTDGAANVSAMAEGAAAAALPAQPPRSFRMCMTCHSALPGENKEGPSLFGIIGRKAGTEPGFDYSYAMLTSGRKWDEISLDQYLTDPEREVPGNKMNFEGVDNEEARWEVIQYLKTLK